MQSERWRQISRLFHLTLELKPEQRSDLLRRHARVTRPCAPKFESLISSHELAQSFIEKPAFDLAAEYLANDANGLSSGQVVGPYKIISVLGTGGMGEVYLAHDSRLGRQAALKILPAHFNIDSQRLQRFEQEARAASRTTAPEAIAQGTQPILQYQVPTGQEGMTNTLIRYMAASGRDRY